MRGGKRQRADGAAIIFPALILAVVCAASLAFAAIQEAEVAFLKGDYSDAMDECEEILKSSGAGPKDRAYFLKGQSLLKLNKSAAARESFEQALLRFPRSRYREDARLGIGDSYFAEGNFSEAIRAYEALRQKFHKGRLSAIALYKIGRSYEKSGDSSKAAFYYQILRHDYPLSFEAKLVDGARGEHYYTVQVGSFGLKKNAERLTGRLKDKGFDAHIDVEAGFYKVRVGKFQSEEELTSVRDRLNRLGYNTKITLI